MIEFKEIEEAKAAGYFPLTRPYRDTQGHLWLKVLEDMRAGDIRHCLVEVPVNSPNGTYTGVEVWRER